MPAALFVPAAGGSKPGYPGLGLLLDAFIAIRDPDPLSRSLKWWEYDFYIGFVAFAMIGFGLLVSYKRLDLRNHIPFFGAAGILLMFSLGSTLGLVQHSNLPFVNLERVPTRFIVIPFRW